MWATPNNFLPVYGSMMPSPMGSMFGPMGLYSMGSFAAISDPAVLAGMPVSQELAKEWEETKKMRDAAWKRHAPSNQEIGDAASSGMLAVLTQLQPVVQKMQSLLEDVGDIGGESPKMEKLKSVFQAFVGDSKDLEAFKKDLGNVANEMNKAMGSRLDLMM